MGERITIDEKIINALWHSKVALSTQELFDLSKSKSVASVNFKLYSLRKKGIVGKSLSVQEMWYSRKRYPDSGEKE